MRWQLASTFAALAMSGCYEERTVPCENGVLCPSKLACTENDPASGALLCADEPNVTACGGEAPRTPCNSSLVDNGLCVDGVCEQCTDPSVFECRYDVWTRVVANPNGLTSIWVETPSVAYAVGNSGVTYRFDGTQWHVAEQSGRPGLVGVWSKDGDVFTAASDGTTYRNGAMILPVASFGLQAIWGAGPGAVTAVGNELTTGAYAGSLWAWTDSPGSFTELHDVYGWGTDDVVVVGSNGVAMHKPMNSSAFATVSPAYPNSIDDLKGVWGTSPGSFYVVGAAGANDQTGLVRRYSVNGWTIETLPPSVPRLDAIWGNSDESVIYAVGIAGTVVRRVNGVWSTMSTSPTTTANFEDVSGSGTDAYAVAADGTLWRISPR